MIAITPARSRLFMVRSRWSSDVDSGRNSANAIAPVDERFVEDRNSRLSALLSVKAVRRDWTCSGCQAPARLLRGP